MSDQRIQEKRDGKEAANSARLNPEEYDALPFCCWGLSSVRPARRPTFSFP